MSGVGPQIETNPSFAKGPLNFGRSHSPGRRSECIVRFFFSSPIPFTEINFFSAKQDSEPVGLVPSRSSNDPTATFALALDSFSRNEFPHSVIPLWRAYAGRATAVSTISISFSSGIMTCDCTLHANPFDLNWRDAYRSSKTAASFWLSLWLGTLFHRTRRINVNNRVLPPTALDFNSSLASGVFRKHCIRGSSKTAMISSSASSST
mmetsp:Transcript_25774/g.62090  ORF Transcript_25774/g.62090 Transcript_25774/m.62090 type:complete len:207 (-) Transcript_25774:1110-1730(-)